MNELIKGGVKTISSREVAEMMEVRHDHLLEKIDKINKTFDNRKIGSEKYWIKSTFENRGKQYREFQVTKKGCEFLAHKSTGEKGIIFTDRYMNRFEEMERALEELNKPSYMIEDPVARAERWIEEYKEKQKLEEENKQLTSEVQYKEDVIIGLTQDIDLCTKRQRITQIIRHKAKDNYAQRWNLLYSEFERKYHIDLKRRIANCNVKPKIKNKIDYIERELNMVSELYEIACKIFELDVEELKKEWDI